MSRSVSLTPEEKEVYQWQFWVEGFGEEGQEKLKAASVLISRCGGVGSVAAYELAAAGIGKLIIAHGGLVRPSDLNRQILMTHDWIGKPRIESVTRRLKELNPFTYHSEEEMRRLLHSQVEMSKFYLDKQCEGLDRRIYQAMDF